MFHNRLRYDRSFCSFPVCLRLFLRSADTPFAHGLQTPAEQNVDLPSKHKAISHHLSASQIVEATTSNPYDSILKFLNSSNFPSRASFPQGFLFGSGSSALQIEGGCNEGGRGLGIWDDIVIQNKDVYLDVDKFPLKIDHYNRYKEIQRGEIGLALSSGRYAPYSSKLEDVVAAQRLMDFYWGWILDPVFHGDYPQIMKNLVGNRLPKFTKKEKHLLKGSTNFIGINYYTSHFARHEPNRTKIMFDNYDALAVSEDLPSKHKAISHHLSASQIVEATTSNPYDSILKFLNSSNFPSRASFPQGFLFGSGSSALQIEGGCNEGGRGLGIWDDIVIQNKDVYLDVDKFPLKIDHYNRYKEIQRGEIGLALSSGRYAPYSSKLEDVVAAQRLMDFYWGWILDPVFHGDYPQIMKKLVGNRLPKFTKKEKHLLKGSTNFIGINYYTSHFARHEPNRTKIMFDNYDALAVSEVFNAEGKTLGYKDQYSGSNVYPEGLYNMLVYIKKKYKNPKIYVTENGISSSKIPNPLKDEHRIAYIAAHINATKAAIE
ncbi:hypothetical protein KIW84_072089 [Lathyrus oleraceus]|uniref:Beta-glucosidase n=1 Tax=Pisum sativum TaxID=3888 RepID=A0A9D4ZUM6_PEA|nr:hypothetical protein KIW84_072089 [Pisum sativum]